MASRTRVLAAVRSDPTRSPEELLVVALAAAARLDGTPGKLELERAPATVEYLSRQGDTLDLIAHARYGSAAAVRNLLAANPDLAAAGPVLEVGTKVMLPDLDAAPEQREDVVQLWD